MNSELSEERLALFLDYENVAIGARDNGYRFDIATLMDALAERGRVLVRRAYADWNLFREDRRSLVDGNVELIEIPQRSDEARKNAADIKLAVDAMELALAHPYVSTFVVVSGDSDFTPLVTKLRTLNRKVIGVGLKGSTSRMLPPACDEFIFYDRLDTTPRQAPSGKQRKQRKERRKDTPTVTETDLQKLARTVTQTLSGLQSSATGPIYASNLKRALLRKDPTFSEQDYGFRAFREMLEHLAEEGHLSLSEGAAPGDPELDFPRTSQSEDEAFQLLADTVKDLMKELGGDPPLSGLKDQVRKRQSGFSEKDFGYSGFLQFCKAAVAKGYLEIDWEEEDEEYYLYVPGAPVGTG